MSRTNERTRERQEVEAFTLRLPVDQYEALKAVAFATGRTVTDVVRASIASYLGDAGRQQEFDALLEGARNRHRLALDKLAGL